MNPAAFKSRKTTLQRMDDTFDREFWADVAPSTRLEMVWELSLRAFELAGKIPDESGHPRSVAHVHRP
jgi:hypothetical protein